MRQWPKTLLRKYESVANVSQWPVNETLLRRVPSKEMLELVNEWVGATAC